MLKHTNPALLVCAAIVSATLTSSAHPPVEVMKSKGAGADAAAWARLGNNEMQQARETQSHNFAAAEEAFQKALAIDPALIEALIGMAWVKNSEHDFEAGKEWAEKALALDPRAQDAHSLLGDHAVELGDYDEAYDHYQTALDIRPDLASYARAGHLLWVTGDSSQAQFLMEKAIAAGGPYPENRAWCRVELAMMQLNSGALLAAEMGVRKALAEAPENPRVLAGMGRVSAAKGDHAEAISYYGKSVEIMPTHQALAALVDLYLASGDVKAAEKQKHAVLHFHKKHTHGGEAAEGHTHGGHTHGGASSHSHHQESAELALFMANHNIDPDAAVREAEAVYKTYKNVLVADTLAWCYYKTGDLQKARRMIQRALKWKTRDPSLLFHGGMIYHKSGDERKARELLSRCLNMNPNFHPLDAATARDALKSLTAVPKPPVEAEE